MTRQALNQQPAFDLELTEAARELQIVRAAASAKAAGTSRPVIAQLPIDTRELWQSFVEDAPRHIRQWSRNYLGYRLDCGLDCSLGADQQSEVDMFLARLQARREAAGPDKYEMHGQYLSMARQALRDWFALVVDQGVPVGVVLPPLADQSSAPQRLRALGVVALSSDIDAINGLLEQQRQIHGKPSVLTSRMRIESLCQLVLYLAGQGRHIGSLAEVLSDPEAIVSWLHQPNSAERSWGTSRNNYVATVWAILNWLPIPDDGRHGGRATARLKHRDEQRRAVVDDIKALLRDRAHVTRGLSLPGRRIQSHYKLTSVDVARLEAMLDDDVERERFKAASRGVPMTSGLLQVLRRRAQLRLAMRNCMRAESLATIDMTRVTRRKKGGLLANVHLKGTIGHEEERTGDWWLPADVWELYVEPYIEALRIAGADMETPLQLMPSATDQPVLWGMREVDEPMTVLPLWRKCRSLSDVNDYEGYAQMEKELSRYMKRIHPLASLHCTRSWAARYMAKVLRETLDVIKRAGHWHGDSVLEAIYLPDSEEEAFDALDAYFTAPSAGDSVRGQTLLQLLPRLRRLAGEMELLIEEGHSVGDAQLTLLRHVTARVVQAVRPHEAISGAASEPLGVAAGDQVTTLSRTEVVLLESLLGRSMSDVLGHELAYRDAPDAKRKRAPIGGGQVEDQAA